MATGNGSKDGLYSVLLRDYGPHAAATCMNRLAKLRWDHTSCKSVNNCLTGSTTVLPYIYPKMPLILFTYDS